MSKQSARLVPMTSTELFKVQANNIYAKLRHENGASSGVRFMPTHLGGVLGQTGILCSKSIMRQLRVTQ